MFQDFQIDQVEWRIFNSGDSIQEVNTLLLAAYRPLAEAGMRYAASYEDLQATAKHIANGECHLALFKGKILACAILRRPGNVDKSKADDIRPDWYKSNEVATFGRFAVWPELQGKGLGAAMMDVLEERARQMGFSELALDTSERAHHLIRMYEKRGYRFIGYHKWESTNYRSLVLSKTL